MALKCILSCVKFHAKFGLICTVFGWFNLFHKYNNLITIRLGFLSLNYFFAPLFIFICITLSQPNKILINLQAQHKTPFKQFTNKEE